MKFYPKLFSYAILHKYIFVLLFDVSYRVGDSFDLKKKMKKIGFIWFKSDFFDLNRFLIFFSSNHPTPLEVNQSSSAQCVRDVNSNYAIKIKQI